MTRDPKGRHSNQGRWSLLVPIFAVALLIPVSLGAAPQSEPEKPSSTLGKTTFRSYCQSCHGAGATGDGPVGKHLNVPPSDLTQIASRNGGQFPTEEVYAKIDGTDKVRAHGTSEMPVWGDAFAKTMGGISDDQVDKRIRNLVAFLESIQQ